MPFYLKNVETGLYLDIKGSSTEPGTEVITWTFTGGKNQQWTYRNNMIYSELNGLVLDISKGEDKGSIIVYSPHGKDNQKWHFDDDFTIRSESGEVLDVSGAESDAGARLIGYRKHGQPNQQFRVEPEAKVSMPFYIKNTTTGLVLDVQGQGRNKGTPVIMWTFTGQANQLWEYKHEMLYSKASGLVLDIDQSSSSGQLIVWNPHGADNQKWHFDDDFTIRSRKDGRVIDVQGANRSSGASLVAYKKHGQWNQKFRVVPFCY